MSPAPGVTVTRPETAARRSFDTDTGKLFIAGLTERGPTDAFIEVRKLSEFVDAFGGRQSYSTLYDELELYFREGGARALVARYAGPSALKAKRNLLDASAGVSLVVEALGVGSYANAWTVAVDHPTGSTFRVIFNGVEGDGSAFTETSPEFATTAEAVAHTWEHVTVTQGASVLDPAVLAASALASTTTGADDRASATDTQRDAALDLFTDDLGPGQVKVAGATATATHAVVEAHAETYGRVAILDGTDTATVATLTAQAATDQAVTGARNAGLFAPWVQIPSLTSGGAERTVPPGAFYAALVARNDGQGISPNQAAAANHGSSNGYVTGLSQVGWSDADRATLSEAGVTVIRDFRGVVQVYDNKTIGDPTDEPAWTLLSNARFFSKIRAEAQMILEGYLFRQIDGAGHLLGAVEGDLIGLLLPYVNNGLSGSAASPAFIVDMSDNTDESIANNELHASLALRISSSANTIELAIVKVSVAGSVA